MRLWSGLLLLCWGTPLLAQTPEIFYSFGSEANTPTALIQATNGLFYGTTSGGGATNNGTFFQVNPNTGSLVVLRSFQGNSSEGSFPFGNLIQARDGQVYGTTLFGGAFGQGTVYRFDPVSGSLSTLASFGGSANSFTTPFAGLLEADDGNFYGTATFGGNNEAGAIFRFDPLNQALTALAELNETVGRNSLAPLIQASDGLLYGVASAGGSEGAGTILRVDPATGALTAVFDFDGTLNGSAPQGGLIQSADGTIYGTTSTNGAAPDDLFLGKGTVFQFNPTTEFLTTLVALPSDSTLGSTPVNRLLQTPDGILYGTTSFGGTGTGGTLFKLSGSLTTLYNFTGGNDGRNPVVDLILGTDGQLYGATQAGGINNKGTLFRLALAPVNPSQVALSLDPVSQTIALGSSAVYDVAVQRTNFSGPVTLAVTGVPTGATVGFSSQPTSENSVLVSINATTATQTGTFSPIFTGTAVGVKSIPAQGQLIVAGPTASADLSSHVSFTRSGLIRINRIRQQITVENTGSQAIPGPLYLALNNLTPGVRLTSGLTGTSPSGAPLILVTPVGQSLNANQRITVLVEFENPTPSPLIYQGQGIDGGFLPVSLQITASGFSQISRVQQQVTIRNTGTAMISGPLFLALANLTPGANLINRTTTINTLPAIGLTATFLTPNASLLVTLELDNPTPNILDYTPQLFQNSSPSRSWLLQRER